MVAPAICFLRLPRMRIYSVSPPPPPKKLKTFMWGIPPRPQPRGWPPLGTPRVKRSGRTWRMPRARRCARRGTGGGGSLIPSGAPTQRVANTAASLPWLADMLSSNPPCASGRDIVNSIITNRRRPVLLASLAALALATLLAACGAPTPTTVADHSAHAHADPYSNAYAHSVADYSAHADSGTIGQGGASHLLQRHRRAELVVQHQLVERAAHR